MRPVTLHLSGFTTFRSPTDINFEGADLFALTGPTGSGKSSIIDAICFALYGTVPRLSGIAPVVSLGKPEARIRLTFEVEGDTYTVSRLIVRQNDGASQRDVRLEGAGLAIEGAREVDARITQLLGLSFDHFTRTVVLPQGRFAAFLDDGPAAREKLLKQLLDLGVYEEMRKRGAAHADRLATESNSMGAQLHDLLVDESQVVQTEARLEQLRQLSERVSELVRAEEGLAGALNATRQARDRMAVDIERLHSIEPPKSLAGLDEQLEQAREVAALAGARSAEAESTIAQLVQERTGIGEIAALDRSIEAHGRVVDLTERVERGSEVAAEAKSRLETTTSEAVASEATLQSVVDALRDLENVHAAHALRESVVAGQPCPVCLQFITTVPEEPPPPDLALAADALAAARDIRDSTARRLNEVSTEVARVDALVEQRCEELEMARVAVTSMPSLTEVVAARERALVLDANLVTAREEAEAARRALIEAESLLERAAKAGKEVSAALDSARDTLAGLDPPSPSRVDAAADWRLFLDWLDDVRTDFAKRSDELTKEVSKQEAEVEVIRRALLAEMSGADLTVEDPRVSVAAAVAATETTLVRMRSDLAKRQELEARRLTVEAQRIRYDETAKLLRSNKFQQWLIEEALVGLVEFANAELAKLAGGAYSLAVDAGDFEVIDHRNAEARRSVKTLSGGETFLVSLALALALAERVVATSAIGTARIESMFLDEGFGTLDAETLDTVAAVVQELGSRDRMIGLVTHVRELADQIPTRYEVRKLPDGSTVVRVES